jgi:predicted DNA-binding transcriptional regulator YafY
VSNLFSEIYGCYFNIVSCVLNKSKDGIFKTDIEKIINEHGFSETEFHLLPELIGNEWNFLEKRGDVFYSRLPGQFNRPITQLELSWLAGLINDPRFKLFLSEEKLIELRTALKDIVPAFNTDNFVSIDKHNDGDPYNDSAYIVNFHKVLNACKNNDPIKVAYDSDKTGRSERNYYPFKISYSELNDKFRLLCAAFDKKTQKLKRVTLNIGRIISVESSSINYRVSLDDLSKLFFESIENPPIVLEITKERNALERFLIQFASFDRKTEYDPERDIYTCQIYYDLSDETELLIRILSFGPTVKVLGPENFLKQVEERLTKQIQLMNAKY